MCSEHEGATHKIFVKGSTMTGSIDEDELSQTALDANAAWFITHILHQFNYASA
jgi:hypothetical protein